jgi:hypothetical protein
MPLMDLHRFSAHAAEPPPRVGTLFARVFARVFVKTLIFYVFFKGKIEITMVP